MRSRELVDAASDAQRLVDTPPPHTLPAGRPRASLREAWLWVGDARTPAVNVTNPGSMIHAWSAVEDEETARPIGATDAEAAAAAAEGTAAAPAPCGALAAADRRNTSGRCGR